MRGSGNAISKPVVIIGGGIGGISAALGLAKKGIPSKVLEQTSEFFEVGAGIQLGPNAFRAFARLGLRDRIMADVWRPPGLKMRDALTAEKVTRIPLGEQFEKRFGEPYAVTHRADLHGALVAVARENDLVTLETSQKVVGYEQDEQGVTVSLAGGGSVEGSALIGADGLWSKVREQIINDGPPVISGHIAYRAVLTREEVPEDLWDPDVVLWAGPKTHLVHYPLRRGELFNLVAVFHSDKYVTGWNSEGDVEMLMRSFSNERPEVLRLLERINTWRMWVLCDREPIKNWSNGRTVLLGDAAHPMLQYLAQGAAMSVEDGVHLAEEVAARPDDIPTAFRHYHEARYLRTGKVQVTSRVYGEIYHADGVKAELRHNMLNGRSAEQTYTGMEWLYGHEVPRLQPASAALGSSHTMAGTE